MKVSLRILVVGIAVLVFQSCKKPNAKINSQNKIMILGDSRVEGNRPDYESFRYELWKNLLDNGWAFDFVGTNYDNAKYPKHLGQFFDRNHEGHGGFRVDQILDGLEYYIDEAGVPSIVIFGGVGGNDALQGQSTALILSNTNAVIDYLQNVNPNITIFIDQLPPARSTVMTSTLWAQLDGIHNGILALATAQTTASSKVVAVDCFTGFDDSYLEEGDDSHYNETGAKWVADRWDAAMDAFYAGGKWSN